MRQSFTAKASIEIEAPAARVWQALTDPALIKQYLFGTEAVSDWRPGSPVRYSGIWQGKPYEDKGAILEAVPGSILRSTYWSGLSGLPDEPENYSTVTYKLSEKKGRTTLSLTQDNNPTPESADHSTGNWHIVLKALKNLLEK